MIDSFHIYRWENSCGKICINKNNYCFKEYVNSPGKFLEFYFLETDFILEEVRFILKGLKIKEIKYRVKRTTVKEINHPKTNKWDCKKSDSVISVRLINTENKSITSNYYKFVRFLFETNNNVIIMRRAMELKQFNSEHSLYEYMLFAMGTCQNGGHCFVSTRPFSHRSSPFKISKANIILDRIRTNINLQGLTIGTNRIEWKENIKDNYEKFKKSFIDE